MYLLMVIYAHKHTMGFLSTNFVGDMLMLFVSYKYNKVV